MTRGVTRTVGARGARRWPLHAAALLAVVTTAACAGDTTPTPSDSPATSPASTAARSTTGPDRPPAPLLGVFRGTEQSQVASFESWLGRRVDAVVDFPARDTWAQVADPTYLLDHWRGTPYRLVLSVPTRPHRQEASDAAGASGAYDHYYAQLGQRLVAAGHPDAMLRIGWEFNMDTSDSYSSDPTAFKTYFRRIVATLRATPGQHFAIIWNPGNGDQATRQDASAFYPGDDVVDIVGLDVYDTGYHPQGYPYPSNCGESCRADRATFMWDNLIYGGKRGIKYWLDFSKAHDKPMSFPEWGLWSSGTHPGGDDDPDFLRRMHGLIADPGNDVVLQAYFEWDNSDDRHRLETGGFPRSASVFREYWGNDGNTGRQ